MNEMTRIQVGGETALAMIPASAVSIIVAADPNDILGKLAAKVAAHKPDVSTTKGRDEMRSLAAEIARAKMDLIRLGKGLTEADRARIKAVNGECSILEERMDALKDQVRAPLTEYENREKARVAGHEAALDRLHEAPGFYTHEGNASADYRLRLTWLEAQPTRDWEEFANRASDVLAQEIRLARSALENAEKREAEAAELTRLREEAVERARQDAIRLQAERERQIAADAAAKAKRDAEAAAERERLETMRVAADERARVEREAQEAAAKAQAEQQRVERERLAAEERAAAAERSRIAAEKQAKADAEAATQRAEAARVAAAEQARRDQVAAVEAERRRAELAAVDEKRRQEAEVAAKRAEDERRAADKAHRKAINAAALAALLPLGLSEELGQAVIVAIAKGQVPAVSITY